MGMGQKCSKSNQAIEMNRGNQKEKEKGDMWAVAVSKSGKWWKMERRQTGSS